MAGDGGNDAAFLGGSLGNTATWQPLSGAVPQAGNFWQAEFLASPVRAYFRVQPAVIPVAPPNVRLVMTGDHFRLEWDSTSDAAGHAVYIGQSPNVGPGNFLQRLPLPLANALEITGLTAGQSYYITIAATNAVGEGATAAAVNGVFGPKVDFTGRAVYSYLLPSGAAFQVLAEGTILRLERTGGGGGTGYETTVDAQGEFNLQDLPAGSYLISYFVNGQFVLLPEPARNWPGTAASVMIVPPSGPSPPPPGTTLLGYLNLSNGHPARISVPEFGLNAQAHLTVEFGDGSSRIVVPDSLGAWAVPEITGGFPVTITGSYQGITTVTTIPAPPATLVPALVQFPQLIPSLQRITTQQNGQEVQHISPGVPVTFTAEVTNPGGVPPSPHWIIEFNGTTQFSTSATPTLTFGTPGATTSGTAHVQFIPSNFSLDTTNYFEFSIGLPPNTGNACWSGIIGIWDPAAPHGIRPAHPATSSSNTRQRGSRALTTLLTQNGVALFDMPVDPVHAALLSARGQAWPHALHLAIRTSAERGHLLRRARRGHRAHPNLRQHAHSHPSLRRDTIFSLRTVFDGNNPWFGPILVKMVSWDPLVRSPMPPGLESPAPVRVGAVLPFSAVWFNITTNGGLRSVRSSPRWQHQIRGRRLESLITRASASRSHTSLTIPLRSTQDDEPCYHQVEYTGYFENSRAAPR